MRQGAYLDEDAATIEQHVSGNTFREAAARASTARKSLGGRKVPAKMTAPRTRGHVCESNRLSKVLALAMFSPPDRVAQLAEQRTFNP